jgi:dihydrofolate reductase
MKCSVYIATSVDGFIAREDGSIDWLESSGNQDAAMGDDADIGFNDFMSSVDCLIMGRNSMEMISSFNLTPEQWPYKDARVIALSNTVKKPPENLKGNVEMYSGDLSALVEKLEQEGYEHAYIDGGKTIQAFLNLNLINEITITRIPILLGKGKSLFGKTTQEIKLENVKAKAFPNDFVQVHYRVRYQ